MSASQDQLAAAPLSTAVHSKGRAQMQWIGHRWALDHLLVLGDPTVGHQGGCSAGAWDLDLNDNSKSALGEPISPTGDHHGLPHQPPASSRLSLGRHRRLCSSNKGQTHENSNDGSNHDYLPLVRTGEVEGSIIRARALSQLPLPPPLLSSAVTHLSYASWPCSVVSTSFEPL